MATKREYQRNFSEILPEAVYSKEIRERKAKTIVAVLDDFLKEDLKTLSLLELGSSTGIISNYLTDYFRKVVAIDIDWSAIKFAQRNFNKNNLEFAFVDAMNMAFAEGAFDIVICAHVYEHVPDATRLMDEIHRVLRPGGVCYFAAGNRLNIQEPHYKLPLLSVLPKPISHTYFRLCGRGKFYYEEFLTFGGLQKLVNKYLVIDYTKRIVGNPRQFYAEYMIQEGTFKAKLANFIVKYAFWLCPGYIWLLQKEKEASGH